MTLDSAPRSRRIARLLALADDARDKSSVDRGKAVAVKP
jgi:hypothetical protein